MTIDTKPPPLVEEALERLRGRRADAIINASTHRLAETKGQNRKTRRANLAKLRAEVKARRKALADEHEALEAERADPSIVEGAQ